ncbi:hypothetical protein Tcan_01935 [Toxocara canis]|uniref:Uncharacterized protein n=1 Tax=Toxocara canis TaxID=6265 RepID=A0A0B2UWI2_TOXCA|nr:hypothetical protein Tcan_01935 [Toxocara canis]
MNSWQSLAVSMHAGVVVITAAVVVAPAAVVIAPAAVVVGPPAEDRPGVFSDPCAVLTQIILDEETLSTSPQYEEKA